MQLKKLYNLILFCAIYAAAHNVLACNTVAIISSNSHFSIVHRIEAAVYSEPKSVPELKHILIEKNLNPEIYTREPFCLLVVIGAEALQSVLKAAPDKPILALLTRKHTIQQLTQEYAHPGHISAIYLDQPLERQLNLVQHIIPKNTAQSVGVLLGPSSIEAKDKLVSLSKSKNMNINTVYVNKFENPVGVLDSLLDDVNVLLAIPDNRIFNPRTTRGMLLSAFHKQVPLIGYSKTYVNNGALVALYSSNKHIAHQAAKEIIRFLHTNELPAPKYPTDFAVAVNYQVARSLGITIESEAALQYSLYEMENRQQIGGVCTVATNH